MLSEIIQLKFNIPQPTSCRQDSTISGKKWASFGQYTFIVKKYNRKQQIPERTKITTKKMFKTI